MANKLEQYAIEQRAKLLPKNDYNDEASANNYSGTHTRALADQKTPEAGRGSGGNNFLDTPNYNVGTETDINGNPSIAGSGRKPAIANNGSTWGYTPDNIYKAPDTSENTGQVTIE